MHRRCRLGQSAVKPTPSADPPRPAAPNAARGTGRWALRSRRVLVGRRLVDRAVVIDGERIVSILAPGDVPADITVDDVGDHVVMPGVVDTQVRLADPGRAEWEGFDHGTRAAAAGGVTTLADLPLPCNPVTATIEALEAKRWAAQGQLHVDVGLQAALLPGYQDQLEPLIDAGVVAFRSFLTDPGVSDCRQVGETDLESALPVLERRGVTLFMHPERSPSGRPKRGPGTDPRSYAAYRASRPSTWELDAVTLMARLCRQTGARVHLMPLTSAHAVEPLRAAMDGGLPLGAGTAPHYLSFAAEEIPDGDPRFKCRPPIRGDEHREGLWRAMRDGVLDLVASDHSPAPAAKRCLETGDLRRAWPGIASVQLLLPATWTAALGHGFGLPDISQWLSSRPASLLGLRDRKGQIAPGLDADLVIWDPEDTFDVHGADLEHRHSQTPWSGARLFGVVHRTIVRGRTVYGAAGFAAAGGRLIER
ncbi:MAG: allantoinase AllB [Acidobacteriota bacterium]